MIEFESARSESDVSNDASEEESASAIDQSSQAAAPAKPKAKAGRRRCFWWVCGTCACCLLVLLAALLAIYVRFLRPQVDFSAPHADACLDRRAPTPRCWAISGDQNQQSQEQNQTRRVPLLVDLHGLTGDFRSQRESSGFASRAERGDAVLVWPQVTSIE